MTASQTTSSVAPRAAPDNIDHASQPTIEKCYRLQDSTPLPDHPLGPLNAREISQSSILIRQSWSKGIDLIFKVITLQEPIKCELLSYLEEERRGMVPKFIDRRSFVVYYIKNTV